MHIAQCIELYLASGDMHAGGPGSGRHPGGGMSSMYLDPKETKIIIKGSHLGVNYEVHYNPGYASATHKFGNDREQVAYESANRAEAGAKARIALEKHGYESEEYKQAKKGRGW